MKTKILPQAPEIENLVLGAILLENHCFDEVASWLKPESFFDERNQIIYKTICDMKRHEKRVDIATLTYELKEKNIFDTAGGHGYLPTLTDRIASSAHIVSHAMILTEKFIQREILKASDKMLCGSWDNYSDALELFEAAKKSMNEIEELIIKNTHSTMATIARQAVEEIEHSMRSGKNISGVSTGFANMDLLTLGRRDGELTIIAARPSLGKTAYALCEAWNVSRQKVTVFFSLEMSATELFKRLISMISQIDHEAITTGRLTTDELNKILKATGEIERNENFIIQDCHSLSISEFKAICRKLKRTNDLGAVYVDYLQLMTGEREKNSNRDQEIGTISRGLKMIAKELNIPVVALSQLSRLVETRSDKRPIMSDLRESGNIEQDADVVNFIYRAERYGFETTEVNGVNESTHNLMEIIQAKFRGGKLGSAFLDFEKTKASISDKHFGSNSFQTKNELKDYTQVQAF